MKVQPINLCSTIYQAKKDLSNYPQTEQMLKAEGKISEKYCTAAHSKYSMPVKEFEKYHRLTIFINEMLQNTKLRKALKNI